jgi:signal transduction histidine kinase
MDVAKNLRDLRNNVAGVLLERRWLLLVLLGLSAFIFEIWEHQHVENPVDIHFLREVIFFGIIYPIGVGLLLNTLLKVQAERNESIRQREIEKKLNITLLAAKTWKDLCLKIVHFPGTLLPVVGVSLFSYADVSNEIELEADWWLVTPEGRPHYPRPLALDYCGVDHRESEHNLHPFIPTSGVSPYRFRRFCLPLVADQRLSGLIFLYLPISEPLTTDQITMLNGLGTIIANAMASTIFQGQAKLQTETIKVERERIARQLHDTLAQNLAYLRLKLDQMSITDALNDIAVIQQDLERMRDIANEAHEQIRQTLSELRPGGQIQLNDLLVNQAREAANLAGFDLQMNTTGEIVPLSWTTQRKIHAIFREALYNIQRHARASAVQLTINWDKSVPELMIVLEDNGVGFEPQHVPSPGHFGLLIMRQRAEEFEGDLAVISAPNQGTRVELHYPLQGHLARSN